MRDAPQQNRYCCMHSSSAVTVIFRKYTLVRKLIFDSQSFHNTLRSCQRMIRMRSVSQAVGMEKRPALQSPRRTIAAKTSLPRSSCRRRIRCSRRGWNWQCCGSERTTQACTSRRWTISVWRSSPLPHQ